MAASIFVEKKYIAHLKLFVRGQLMCLLLKDDLHHIG
jgi:hypothetical protein